MRTKICPKCELELPLDDTHFASRYDRKEKKFQHICRKCQSEYRKNHYEKNKKKYIDKAKVFAKSIIEWFTEHKKTLKCKVCGENRHWVLDFHHRNPEEKDVDVSNLIRKGNKTKILNEIDKCDILCSNCHRDLHYKLKNASIA